MRATSSSVSLFSGVLNVSTVPSAFAYSMNAPGRHRLSHERNFAGLCGVILLAALGPLFEIAAALTESEQNLFEDFVPRRIVHDLEGHADLLVLVVEVDGLAAADGVELVHLPKRHDVRAVWRALPSSIVDGFVLRLGRIVVTGFAVFVLTLGGDEAVHEALGFVNFYEREELLQLWRFCGHVERITLAGTGGR